MNSRKTWVERRNSVSVILLLIVFSALIRPVSPVITDVFAHLFNAEKHHELLHTTGIDHVDNSIRLIHEGDKQNMDPDLRGSLFYNSLVYVNEIFDVYFFEENTELKQPETQIILIKKEFQISSPPPDVFIHTLHV